MTEIILYLKQLTKSFGAQTILDNIDLQMEKQSFIVIQGRSGSGKSTLLNIIAGLEKQDTGHYSFQGQTMENLPQSQLSNVRRHQMGYITQQTPVISSLTVWDNVCFPIYMESDKALKNTRFKRARSLLYELGLEPLKDNKVDTISGGELQRLGVARSLLSNPELIIADEPTGSLDDDTALETIQLLKSLNESGSTIILATHSHLVAEQGELTYKILDGKLLQNT